MFMFVLSGSASLEVADHKQVTKLNAGSSVTLPSLFDFNLEVTTDNTQILVVELPA